MADFLDFYFFFFFVWAILVPWPGSEPTLPALETVLTIGPPWKFQLYQILRGESDYFAAKIKCLILYMIFSHSVIFSGLPFSSSL